MYRILSATERKVGPDGRVRNARELETAKDETMGKMADYGLVVWKSAFKNRLGRESASKGSLRNMYQLTSHEKPVVLYMLEETAGTEAEFTHIVLRNVQDLERVVDACPVIVAKAYREIAKGGQKGSQTEARLFVL